MLKCNTCMTPLKDEVDDQSMHRGVLQYSG